MAEVTRPAPLPASRAVAAPAVRPSIGRDGITLAARHLVLMSRRPASIFGAIVFPLVFTLLFFTVFGKSMERVGIDYAQYLLPAVVIQAMFFTGMSSSVLAAEDVADGMLSRLKAMPVSRAAPYVGLLAAEASRAIISICVLVAVGLLLGFRFERGLLGVMGFAGIAVAFSITASSGYIAMGLKVGRPDAAQALNALPYFPLLLLSNAFVPAAAFPSWLQPFVRNQPVSQVADALRALSTKGYDLPVEVGQAVAWLAGLCLVFAVLATRAFARSA